MSKPNNTLTTTTYRRLKPYITTQTQDNRSQSTPSSGIFELLNQWKIVRYKSSGGVQLYANTDSGLSSANTDASSGDVIAICTGSYSNNYTIASGIEWLGVGDGVELAGTITNNGVLSHITVSGTITNNGTLNNIIDPAGATQMTGSLGLGITPATGGIHCDISGGSGSTITMSSATGDYSVLHLYNRAGSNYEGWALVMEGDPGTGATGDFFISRDEVYGIADHIYYRIDISEQEIIHKAANHYFDPYDGTGTRSAVYIRGSETQNKHLFFQDTTSGEEWLISHRTDASGNALQTYYYDGAYATITRLTDALIRHYVATQVDGVLTTKSGRVVNTTRVTTTYTILVTDHTIYCDTDGGAFTATLPAGVDGQTFRIINCGSSGNDVTIAPNGGELLTGVNANRTLSDGSVIILTYETTEGWW